MVFLGDDWSDCFHIKNLVLPITPYLGFTAMTGDVSDAHEYVISSNVTLINLTTTRLHLL